MGLRAVSGILFLALCASVAYGEIKPRQKFEAEVVRVIDGDTFIFEVELFNVIVRGRCRALGYNAPETRGEERREGERARAFLISLIGDNRVLIEAEEKTDRYGRWLCRAWLPDGTCVNERMREFLKDYPGRDRYLREDSALPATRPQAD